MTFPLVDIGLNLAHDSFDHDRGEVVAGAVAAGVTRMVITGSTLESTRRALEIVRSAPERYRCTAGIHPHHAREFPDECLPQLRELVARPEVGAARVARMPSPPGRPPPWHEVRNIITAHFP